VRRTWTGTAAVLLALTGCAGGADDATPAAGTDPPVPTSAAPVADARAAAQAFLDEYVDPDGRVVRRDQGGDSVGEAQSYGLVLAEVAGDEDAAARIWAWTDANLRRADDGLLAHRWADGTVTDDDSAADADLVTAWALLRADGADAAAMRAAGADLADALLSTSVTGVEGGRVLAAGQWATGEPATLNPSYWAIPILRDLARLTGDQDWDELADTAVDVAGVVTDEGTRLPPDWVRVDDGRPAPTPAPDGRVPDVRYSLDAQRTVVWFSLDAGAGERLAATWAELLADPEQAGALALDQDGNVVDAARHAVALVAAAGAAHAAGDVTGRDELLNDAAQLDAEHPSYYGAAWVALGRALLTTDLLAPVGDAP
jgi:endoglucanase